ncbi:unnamed protein product [Mycena citricolor]|uniref:DUF6533 domain-containing protein n=1 Tax=Mycena citricolor TaxID=2018698 RepID=A0AAD2JUG7_9AGAR|nr:unnamed protein product [Mycena citricolor]
MSAADTQEQLNWNYYSSLVSFTLLYYDYVLTLEWEVARYWGLRCTAPSVLFFLNRYGTLFGMVPVVMQNFWAAESSPRKFAVRGGSLARQGLGELTASSSRPSRCECDVLEMYHSFFSLVIQIIIGVMLILRTYALYERSRRVLGFVVGVAALVIAVAVWAVVAGPTTAADVKMPPLDLDRGCAAGVTRSQAAGLAIAWSSMMLFDCVIFVLTLYRALSRRRAMGFQLLTVLLRDGAIYFGVMVLINVANILTFFMGKVDIMFTSDFLVACSSCNQQPYTKGVLATFTSTISSVMISRLMLNLRDPGLQKMPASHGTGTTSMSLGSGTDAPAHGVFSTYVSQAETADTAGTGYYSDHMELEQRLGGR